MTATTRLTARRFRLEVAVPGRLAAAFLCAAWLIAGNEVSAGEKEYAVKGMVVSVNAPAKSFVVSHERIAGLMDAMTMSFDVRQATDLRDIVPGAVVEFTLVVGDSTSYADANNSAALSNGRAGSRHRAPALGDEADGGFDDDVPCCDWWCRP